MIHDIFINFSIFKDSYLVYTKMYTFCSLYTASDPTESTQDTKCTPCSCFLAYLVATPVKMMCKGFGMFLDVI